jgi:hypothetical protein
LGAEERSADLRRALLRGDIAENLVESGKTTL